MPTSIPPVPARRDHKRRARRAPHGACGAQPARARLWRGSGLFLCGRRPKWRPESSRTSRAKRKTGASSLAPRANFSASRSASRCVAIPRRLEIERPSGKLILSAARLTGIAQIYDLNHVIVEAQGPLSLEAPGVSDTEADWRSLLVSFVAQDGALDHADMAVEAPSLRVRDGQNMIATQAERFELHARRDPRRPPGDEAVEISSTTVAPCVSRCSTALSGRRARSTAMPMSRSRKSRPCRQGLLRAPALLLERWRLAGGALRVSTVNLTKGSLKASASGELQLDELHRVLGRLDTSVEGAEALLPRLGLPPTALAFLKLSGGKLRLPITLSNGRMTVGPVSVARLIPLY